MRRLKEAFYLGYSPFGDDIVIGGEGAGAMGALLTLEMYKRFNLPVYFREQRVIALFDSIHQLNRPSFMQFNSVLADRVKSLAQF